MHYHDNIGQITLSELNERVNYIELTIIEEMIRDPQINNEYRKELIEAKEKMIRDVFDIQPLKDDLFEMAKNKILNKKGGDW